MAAATVCDPGFVIGLASRDEQIACGGWTEGGLCAWPQLQRDIQAISVC